MKNARIMIIIQAVLMYVAHIFFFTVFFIDIPKGENNSVGLLLLGIGAAVVCVAAAVGFVGLVMQFFFVLDVVGAIMLHAAMKKAQNRMPDAVFRP